MKPFATTLAKDRYLLLVFMVIFTLQGCGGSDGDDNKSGSSGTASAALSHGRNTSEFILAASEHALGQALYTRVYLPDGSSPLETGATYPVAFGYHGSGGLNKEPLNPGDECTEVLEDKYQQMTDYLNAQGVAVVWVDSFYSRDKRFCEDNTAQFRQFAPAVMDNNLQQVVSRLYDTVAAETAFCKISRFDCNRMMRIGTSEGASAALLPSHRFIDHTLQQLFDSSSPYNKIAKLPLLSYHALPVDRPQPQFVMAISPGCGFYSAVPFTLTAASENLFYPAQPVYLELGALDTIPGECSTSIGTGTRQLQAEEIQSRETIAAADYRYHVNIHAGAGHWLWEEKQDDLKAALTPLVETYLK